MPTGTKQADEALAHQRRLYEAVLSTTPDLAYIFDLDHRFIYANEGLLRMWGKSWDQAIGKNCLELGYEPWHAAMHDREIEQVIATRQPIRGLVPFTGTFGRRIYDYIFTPVLDADGRVQAVAGTTRDVTEIKQAEEARRASEERLAAELASMRRLHELSLRLTQTDNLEQVMAEVMAAAAELLGATRSTAQLLEPSDGSLRLVATKGFDQSFADRFGVVTADGITTCASALTRRDRVIVPDLASDPAFAGMAAIAVPAGVRAAMSTPLLASGGGLLGVFTLCWEQPHAPSDHELRLLDLYVQQAARLVERRAAEHALRRSEQQLEAELADTRLLQQISAAMIHQDNVEAIYDQIIEAAVSIMRADFASMQMLYPDRGKSGELRLLATHGFSPEATRFWEWVSPESNCSCGEAYRTRKRALIPDIERCAFMAGTPHRAAYLQAGILPAESTPLLSRNGQLIGMISTHWKTTHQPSERDLRLLDILARQAADLIERTQAEQALRRHRETLEETVKLRTDEATRAQRALAATERMASLGTLAAGLGHDMGNLLVPVRVRLDSLASMNLPEEAAHDLIGLKSSADYLQKLASGLRLLAVDPDRAAADETTEIREWWTQAQSVLRNCLPRGVSLEARMPEEPCWVGMSKPGLMQAIFNLVQNAGDAMKDRARGTVKVAADRGDGALLLSVSDNGPGMTEEVKRRCMEPFYTTKARGISTGLGLALVYGLVQGAGGRIELDSTLGIGTTFTLKLPCVDPPTRLAPDGPARLAVVDLKDARIRAIVTAELESVRFSVEFDKDRAPAADLVVADHGNWDGDLKGPLLALTTPELAPKAASALGERPKIHVIREAIRHFSREIAAK